MHDDERPPAESAAGAATVTFLFADIAGYTALTEADGDEQAADLVAEFFKAVSDELPTWGGTHVRRSETRLCSASPTPRTPSDSGWGSPASCCAVTVPRQYESGFTTDRRSSATATTRRHRQPRRSRRRGSDRRRGPTHGIRRCARTRARRHRLPTPRPPDAAQHPRASRPVRRRPSKPASPRQAPDRPRLPDGRRPRARSRPADLRGHRLLLLHAGLRGRIRQPPRTLPALIPRPHWPGSEGDACCEPGNATPCTVRRLGHTRGTTRAGLSPPKRLRPPSRLNTHPPGRSELLGFWADGWNRSTVVGGAGPAARILNPSPNATNGAICATRREAGSTGFDCGAGWGAPVPALSRCYRWLCHYRVIARGSSPSCSVRLSGEGWTGFSAHPTTQ